MVMVRERRVGVARTEVSTGEEGMNVISHVISYVIGIGVIGDAIVQQNVRVGVAH